VLVGWKAKQSPESYSRWFIKPAPLIFNRLMDVEIYLDRLKHSKISSTAVEEL